MASMKLSQLILYILFFMWNEEEFCEIHVGNEFHLKFQKVVCLDFRILKFNSVWNLTS